MAELQTIKDREIFSTGVWNGNVITTKDLDDMVEAFNATKEGVRPYLKLGHDNEQKFLQKEGIPAAGWIDNLRRKGTKLVADYIDLPGKIARLIENKAYRKVSSEVFHNIKIHGKTYRRMLGAVALLGAETPGVMDLKDILSLYGFNDFKNAKDEAENKDEMKVEIFNLTIEGDKMSKTEKEINLERDLAEQKKETEELKEKLSKFAKEQEKAEASEKENKELKEQIEKFKKESAENAEKAKKAEIEKFASELEKENLSTPAMKPYVVALLGDQVEKYSVNEKEMSREELIKETLKLFKSSDVNFDDSSEEGDHQQKTLEAEIEKYMKDNEGVSYRDAYTAVASKTEKIQED